MPIDLTRSLLVVLVPGAVAVTPFLLWLVMYTEITLGLKEEHYVLGNALIFVVVTVAGVICESLGTQLEVKWDAEREDELKVEENWYAYLARKMEHEPPGYRYISRLATMLYFELSMLMATLPCVAGVTALLQARYKVQGDVLMVGMLILAAPIIFFFAWNAKQTHKVLCKTRLELNKRLAEQAKNPA